MSKQKQKKMCPKCKKSLDAVMKHTSDEIDGYICHGCSVMISVDGKKILGRIF